MPLCNYIQYLTVGLCNGNDFYEEETDNTQTLSWGNCSCLITTICGKKAITDKIFILLRVQYLLLKVVDLLQLSSFNIFEKHNFEHFFKDTVKKEELSIPILFKCLTFLLIAVQSNYFKRYIMLKNYLKLITSICSVIGLNVKNMQATKIKLLMIVTSIIENYLKQASTV